MSSDIRIQPLGGVGEIGSNCTLFETKNHKIYVDYGILFPHEEFFNISYLAANLEQQEATQKQVILFITHGHEDHIGAIFHFIKRFPQAKIYAPQFAQLLIRKKLSERGIPARIEVYDDSLKIEFDDYTLTPVYVTHSIPDTYGIIVKEKNNKQCILFISDFKYDHTPPYGRPFDTKKIQDHFAQTSQNICLIDSTNILNPGSTLSESDLIEDLDEILKQERRIFVTMFSSNVHRIKLLANIADKYNKKVVLLGRSIKHYVQSAQEMNIIDETNIIIDESSIPKYTDKYIYLLTGCQGDFFGALRRVSDNEFKNLTIGPDDLFVFSSKAIPGNEKKINRIYNSLTEKGVDIITSRDMNVHASGHPSQKDLLKFYQDIKPDLIIPIHGESYFLKKHKEFCESNGLNAKTFLNNTILSLGSGIKFIEQEPLEPEIYHSNDLVLDRPAISQRRKLALNGMVFLTINKKDRKIKLTINGVPILINEKLPKIESLIKGQLSKKLMGKDDESIEEELRIFTRNIFNNFLGYKPMTFVQAI